MNADIGDWASQAGAFKGCLLMLIDAVEHDPEQLPRRVETAKRIIAEQEAAMWKAVGL